MEALICTGVMEPPTISSSHEDGPVILPWERVEPQGVVRRVKLLLPASWKNSMWTTSPPPCVEEVQLPHPQHQCLFKEAWQGGERGSGE